VLCFDQTESDETSYSKSNLGYRLGIFSQTTVVFLVIDNMLACGMVYVVSCTWLLLVVFKILL